MMRSISPRAWPQKRSSASGCTRLITFQSASFISGGILKASGWPRSKSGRSYKCSGLLRRQRRDEMKAYRVSGQNKAVLQINMIVGFADEPIVACHDQQALLRPQLDD